MIAIPKSFWSWELTVGLDKFADFSADIILSTRKLNFLRAAK